MLPEDAYQLIAKADYGEGFTVALFKTKQGEYFSTVRTIYGRTENFQNLSRERAIETYHKLSIHPINFEDAFSSLQV